MSPTRLHLVAHAHTAALRRAVFGGGDDSLDPAGLAAARALARTGPGRRGPFGQIDACLSTPAEAGRQTAYALGLRPTAVSALADCDYGRWTGLPLAEVGAREPDALRDWLGAPDAAPHGGESVEALLDRVDRWLTGQRDRGGRIVAVTHPVVIRAALVRALRLPAATFWRLDVAPLAVVRLTGRGPGWQLRLGAPPHGAEADGADPE
ncbi:histidine phosphatase family protein [Plantactinospora sp. KLBMP9567]|uniref:histidine phosphatase family protein n=1 Tax=Plantactinospora sp. KLBMP9567 TaxID=3085900 RepID=UPI0029827A67|nr:histidine phosphatase family protein [Plantactinospora sp. KLBMP9567]MDW5324805.1 histidine phosphatase family protein [Plantactinospora sp. KLBMP9567]MDW5330584.1 histidine phosphatase family protein [Plantactinospora sp. KLBMP9567]